MNDQFPMDDMSYMGTWFALDSNFGFEDGLEQSMADMSFDNSMQLPCSEEIALPEGMFDFSLLDQQYQDSEQNVGILDDSFYASTSPSMTSSMEVGVSPAALAWPPQDPYAVPYSSGNSPMGFDEQYLLASFELPATSTSSSPASLPQVGASPKAQSPTDSIPRDLSCAECGKDHKDKRSLRRHYNTNHPSVAKALGIKEPRSECKYCHESFSRKDHLQRHLSNKHGRPRQSRSRR